MRQMNSQIINTGGKKKGLGSALLGLAPAIGSAIAGPWGAVGGGLLSAGLGGGGLGDAISAVPGAITDTWGAESEIKTDPVNTPFINISSGREESGEGPAGYLDQDYNYGQDSGLPPEDQEMYNTYLSKVQDEDPEQAEYLRKNPNVFKEILQQIRSA